MKLTPIEQEMLNLADTILIELMQCHAAPSQKQLDAQKRQQQLRKKYPKAWASLAKKLRT